MKKRIALKVLKSYRDGARRRAYGYRPRTLRNARRRLKVTPEPAPVAPEPAPVTLEPAPVTLEPAPVTREDFKLLGRDALRDRLSKWKIPYVSKLGRGHLVALLWGITTGVVDPDALRAKKLKLADLRAEIDRAMGVE